MMMDVFPVIKLTVCFLALFGVSEFLFHVVKVPVEVSRKFTHIGTGFLSLLFPIWLNSNFSVLLLCSSFCAILVVSKKYGFLKSINGIQRESHGSVSYAVIVFFCFLIWDMMKENPSDTIGLGWFYVPVLVMALADPAAALVGSRWPVGKYRIGKDHKSMAGSLAFFIVAFLVSASLLGSQNESFLKHTLVIVLIAIFSTIAEAVSNKGFDNFTIPAAVLITMYFCLPLLA
jgi:dolichol kinase